MTYPPLIRLLFVLISMISFIYGETLLDPRIVEHPEDQYVAKNEPATLNCKAEGSPAPVITWYRRGQLVTTSNDNLASHRMLLPSGQLFFLKVMHISRNQTDTGVYYCNATNPETNISSISRNATLDIASIREDFREEPKDTNAPVGGVVELVCKPPRGKPEPKIKWKKGGDLMRLSDRVTLEDQSTVLRIKNAKTDDSGVYACIAYNAAGEKESSPAQLSVREKPRILEGPKDVTVQEGGEALFRCQTNSDPEMTLFWRKQESQMPTGRSRILEDRSLRIERVDSGDEGIYVCRVENAIGFQESEARLSVHTQPSFIITPQDKVVGVGRRASFRCQVSGNPLPAVFWNKETSQKLMFPNYDNGRFSVTDEGTLVIESVQPEDGGEYVCKALSVAGSAFAKTKLEVKDVDPRPPPIIHHGPLNQTLPINSLALLQCVASGEPIPDIKWLKNHRDINFRDSRILLQESGTLQISDLRRSDTGLYTCKAMSETGETSWSGALVVEPPTNPAIVFHRTPEPSTFPGPPSRPVPSDVTETSVRLTWRPNPNHGASTVHSFMVEYFSHETGEGWRVASDSIVDNSYVVRDLRPDTPYLFLIRSQNSHGISLPSPVTPPIRTKATSSIKSSLPALDPALVSEKLSSLIITMLQPEVINSTTIKVNWEVRRHQRFIEGFHIRYRSLEDNLVAPLSVDTRRNQLQTNSPSPHEFSVLTILDASVSGSFIGGLAAYTWYEVRVQPFRANVQGIESNSVRVRTYEDLPSAPPENIQMQMSQNNTLVLSWDPPPKQHRRGVLKGYKILIFGNESKYDRELVVNSTYTYVHVHNMVADINYKVQLAAYNRVGEGVRSHPLYSNPQTASLRQSTLVNEPWFLAVVIGAVGGIIWILLCIFSIWIYRRNQYQKKLKKDSSVCTPFQKVEDISNSYQNSHQSQFSNINNSKEQYLNNVQPDVTRQVLGRSPLYYTTSLKDRGNEDDRQYYPYDSVPPYDPSPAYTAKFPSDGLRSNDASFSHANADTYLIEGNNQQYLADDINEWQNNGSTKEGDIFKPILFLPPPPQHPPPPPSEMGTPPQSPATVTHDLSRSSSSALTKIATPRQSRPVGGLVNRLAGSPRAISEPEKTPPASMRHHDNKSIPRHMYPPGAYKWNYSDNEARSMLRDGPRGGKLAGGTSPPSPAPHDFASGKRAPRYINGDVGMVNGKPTRGKREGESSAEPNLQQGSPTSSIDEMERVVADCVLASWTNAIADSEDVIVSSDDVDTISSSSNDEAASSSLLAEVDFATAVSKAAERSGLTVVGSTITDNNAESKERVKKPLKHRQRAPRPSSPYSTDSNYSSLPNPANRPRPYPKSDRRKQMIGDKNPKIGRANSSVGQKPATIMEMSDQNSSTGRQIRTNPLEAFDTRYTPIA